MSDACAIGTRPAVTAAAAPPDEPLVESSGFHGFRHGPCRRLSPHVAIENSGVAERPTMRTPESRTRRPKWLSASNSVTCASGASDHAADRPAMPEPTTAMRRLMAGRLQAEGPG